MRSDGFRIQQEHAPATLFRRVDARLFVAVLAPRHRQLFSMPITDKLTPSLRKRRHIQRCSYAAPTESPNPVLLQRHRSVNGSVIVATRIDNKLNRTVDHAVEPPTTSRTSTAGLL